MVRSTSSRKTASIKRTQIEAGSSFCLSSWALPNEAPRKLSRSLSSSLEAIHEIQTPFSRIADARIAGIEKEISEISDDQKRLRENIEALTKTAEARQLVARYVAKADQQETRLEQLTRDKQTAVDQRLQLQSQLAAAIHDLQFNRKLTE